jgi:type II secretory pathway component GspD/PulD (secretin)
VDASEIKEMLEKQLSPRGSMSIMQSRGQKGWQFASQSRSYSRSGVSMTRRERVDGGDDSTKSKTVIATDIPGVLDRIATVLKNIDVMPKQILVEAKFVEVNDNFLRDVGMELGGAVTIDGNPLSIGDAFFDATPNGFTPASTDISGKNPLNTFGQISFDSASASVLLNVLQENDDSKILSAPSVLTLNNQEATIIVGEKYPIIESDVSGGNSTGNGPISTTLDYYENIGIQLNVVPQISGLDHVNMIVHPSVSSIVGFETGIVSQGADAQALTPYPRISTREAETQIMLKNTETVVIGGLLEERESQTEFKVPLLGDVPFLGWLFKRNVSDTETVDLLIFISATIIDETNYDRIVSKKPIQKEAIPIVVEPEPTEDVEPEPMEEPEMDPVASLEQERQLALVETAMADLSK